MRRTFALLLVIVAMLVMPLGSVFAQDPNAPLYVRYCTGIRAEIGDATIQKGLDDVDALLVIVSDLLSTFDSGNMTVPEGITRAEEIQRLWEGTAKVECLAPLNMDVFRTTNELLIAMLYGQILDLQSQNRHRAVVDQLLISIDSQVDQSRTYLSRPLPTVTPTPATPTPGPTSTPVTEIITATPGLRDSATLSQEMTNYLKGNGVTVLLQAQIEVFPGDTLVTVRLSRFVGSDGNNFDYANSIFTFNALAGLLVDWIETAEISQIAIETYDGTTRTLYVATTGDNFRGRYIENTMSQEEFEAQLTVEPPQ
jgi:hypothetical protein